VVSSISNISRSLVAIDVVVVDKGVVVAVVVVIDAVLL
jgi:hypothetical protein